MAILFNTVGQIEHGKLHFVDAVVDVDVLNGAFGDVATGKFTVGAKKGFAIMQVECGDDEGLAKYPIAKGSHVRCLDLVKSKGQLLKVYGYPLPDTFAKGDKFESDAEGKLVKNQAASGNAFFEVKEVIGNKDGAIVEIM